MSKIFDEHLPNTLNETKYIVQGWSKARLVGDKKFCVYHRLPLDTSWKRNGIRRFRFKEKSVKIPFQCNFGAIILCANIIIEKIVYLSAVDRPVSKHVSTLI